MDLTPTCKIKELYIEFSELSQFNKVMLRDMILDLTIYYDISLPTVTASLILKDPLNLLTSVKSGELLQIYIVDIYDKYYIRHFNIYEMDRLPSNDSNPIVELRLIDVPSFHLLTERPLKGYIDKTISEVFNTYTAGSDMFKGLTLDIGKTSRIRDNVIVPRNQTLLGFLHKELHKDGAKIYQTKDKYCLKPIKSLTPSTLVEHPIQFTNLKNAIMYKGNILSYNIINNGGNNSKVLKSPPKETLVFDSETKSMKSFKQNMSDIYDSVKSTINDNSIIQDIVVSAKSALTTYQTQSQLHDDNLFLETYEKFLKDVEIEIAVAGDVELNIYMIVDVELIMDTRTDTMNEGSPELSGKYIITKLTERFENGAQYVTKLTLNRIGTEKPLGV